MANAVYPLWEQSLMTEADANKSLNQSGANGCYAALVNLGGYVYSASHQFYSSISANIQGTPQEITTPTVAAGLFDGDNVTYTAVTGSTVGAIVIYRQNSGASSTWRLVLYLDTAVASFPMTPAGGNIIVVWNAAGIFHL
jgi:hypothetical protein